MERGPALLILLCLLPALLHGAAAATGDYVPLKPLIFHQPDATIRLTYSAPVIITGGELLDNAWNPLREYGAANFSGNADDTAFTVTVASLVPERYYLVVHKKDAASDQRPLGDDVIAFEYQQGASAFTIHLVNLRRLAATRYPAVETGKPCAICVPETGFSATADYNATFTTSLPGYCRYATTWDAARPPSPAYMAPFPSGGTPGSEQTVHTLTDAVTGGTAVFEPLTVWCNSSQYPQGLQQQFVIGYEDRAPDVTVTLAPAIIVDPNDRAVNLSVRTDQKAYCEATDGQQRFSLAPAGLTEEDAGAYQRNGSALITFADRPSGKTVRSFTLSCIDRAGLTTSRQVNVTIDLDSSPHLTLVSPGTYTANATVVFAVQAQRRGIPVTAGSCAFTDGTAQALGSDDGITFSTSFDSLAEGSYTHAVKCVLAEGVPVTGSFTFTVDRTPPPGAPARTMDVPDYICSDGSLTATMGLSPDTDEDENFAGYRYNITHGTAAFDAGTSSSDEIVSSVSPKANRTYTWNVWAVDLAGNAAGPLTGTTGVVEPGNPLCDAEPPAASLDVTETGPVTSVEVRCADSGSGCTGTFRYDKLAANASAGDCAYATTEAYNKTIPFLANGSICYAVFDRNGNNDTGFRRITVQAPLSDGHCSNGVRDSALGESDVDCGGDCTACGENESCMLNADCASGYCDALGKCAAAACDDAVKNGDESDVDCGGSCTACSVGQACGAATDCASGYCDASGQCAEKPSETPCTTAADCAAGQLCSEGLCISSQDTDNDGMPDAWEKEYGLNPNDPSDASADPDNDGATNLQEYLAGTDPTKADTPTSPAPQEPASGGGISVFGLILIILGLLTMSGSGYWLHTLHEFRVTPGGEEEETSYRARPQELGPEQRLALARQRQEQLARLRQRQEAERQRAAERAESRRGLADAFGTAPEKAQEGTGTAGALSASSTGAAQATPGEEEAGEEGEFIGMDEFAQKAEEKARAERPKEEGKRRKEEQAFSDLDKVIGEKGGRGEDDGEDDSA